jgi:hypothetical protein
MSSRPASRGWFPPSLRRRRIWASTSRGLDVSGAIVAQDATGRGCRSCSARRTEGGQDKPRRRCAHHSPGERGKTKPLGAALALKAAGTAFHRCPEALSPASGGSDQSDVNANKFGISVQPIIETTKNVGSSAPTRRRIGSRHARARPAALARCWRVHG